MRQSAIVNVEVGIEDRFSLFADEGRLRFYPFAGLLLLGVGEKPRFKILHDFRVFFSYIGRFAGVGGEKSSSCQAEARFLPASSRLCEQNREKLPH